MELESMTIPQLKKLCDQKGYSLKSTLKKAEIVRAVGQLMGIIATSPSLQSKMSKVSAETRRKLQENKKASDARKKGA